jgi:ubiquinone/menaquinone biosynthesis C-methylase UbiE
MTALDPRLKPSAVRERYNDPAWYDKSRDLWHKHTDIIVHNEVAKTLKELYDQDGTILNVGSGQYDYGLGKATIINLDISERQLLKMTNAVVSNAESLPIEDNSIKAAVCVGSVINYCDALSVISEFSRVLMPEGLLIIDFESSQSAEYITRPIFNQSAAVAETFYASQLEAVWVYSFEYFTRLLKASDFYIIKHIPIHIVSPWALLLTRSANIATAISSLDRFAAKVTFLSRWASNHLFVCRLQT